MNWIEHMNQALCYIESHLDDDLTLEAIAKEAYCSKFHFARMFSALTGMAVFEYVRKRRLSLAATELQKPDSRVIDVAIQYGYESPESFSKAFKKMHGISPSKVKGYEGALIAVPPLTIQVSLKGEATMNYRIEEKDSFSIVGFKRKITTKDEENFNLIPAFWQESIEREDYKTLMDQQGPLGPLGVITNYDESSAEFDYYIAVEGSQVKDVADQATTTIPGGKWAIFESIGPTPDAIQKVWHRIYAEWFPATNYQHAGTAELEVYFDGDCTREDYRCEVWIPIV